MERGVLCRRKIKGLPPPPLSFVSVRPLFSKYVSLLSVNILVCGSLCACVCVCVYGRIPLSPPLHSVRDNVAPGHTSRSLSAFFLEIRIGASLHCRKKSTDRHDRNLKQNGSMKSDDGSSSSNIISLRHTRALSLPLPDERTFGLEAFLSPSTLKPPPSTSLPTFLLSLLLLPHKAPDYCICFLHLSLPSFLPISLSESSSLLLSFQNRPAALLPLHTCVYQRRRRCQSVWKLGSEEEEERRRKPECTRYNNNSSDSDSSMTSRRKEKTRRWRAITPR